MLGKRLTDNTRTRAYNLAETDKTAIKLKGGANLHCFQGFQRCTIPARYSLEIVHFLEIIQKHGVP